MQADDATLSRRERNKLRTHERLIAAARELFAQRTVAGTTIDDIAAAADVSRATFFNYFPNKPAVLQALWRDMMKNFGAAIDRSLTAPFSTRQRLRDVFRAFVDATVARPNYLRAVIAEMGAARDASSTSATASPAVDKYDALHDALARIVVEGQAQGDVRTDLDVDFLAQMIGAGYLSVISRWQMDETSDLAARFDDAADFLADALAVGAKPVSVQALPGKPKAKRRTPKR